MQRNWRNLGDAGAFFHETMGQSFLKSVPLASADVMLANFGTTRPPF
jgi:hypothetical protein